MNEIILYQQERRDGGLRTGLQANGQTLLHSFQEGTEESDPALAWYVDIRCTGSFPDLTSPEEAREWLSRSSTLLHQAIDAALEELSGGLDVDLRPWEWAYPAAPEGCCVHVVISAMRRKAGLEIATKLRRLSQNWEKSLDDLRPLVAA